MAAERDVLAAIEALRDGVGTIARDEDGTAYDPAIRMRNAVLATLSKSAPDPELPRDRIDEANAFGYREGYRAAEAAHKVATPPSEPLPREALDVERLARAMAVLDGNSWDNRSSVGKDGLRSMAREMAAEYARLSPDRPTPP